MIRPHGESPALPVSPYQGRHQKCVPRRSVPRHHKTCRRKMAEPSLVRRVTTARVFHESVKELLRLLGLMTTRLDGQSHEVIAHLLAWGIPSLVLRCGSACRSVTRRSSAMGQGSYRGLPLQDILEGNSFLLPSGPL